jgi:uncharacterized membrane protein
MAVTSLTQAATPWQLSAMVGWDATALTWLALSWQILYRSDAQTTELRAGDQDPGSVAVFAVAVASSLFSLFAATLVMRMVRDQSCGGFWVVLALVSVGLSWLLTHTAYAFRYAHLFYTGPAHGGLLFPGTTTPTDIDFAYYSFTLGMCFQVSDVQISDPEIRRATLGHALISFVFNTMIVALSLNLMFQFLGTG